MKSELNKDLEDSIKELNKTMNLLTEKRKNDYLKKIEDYKKEGISISIDVDINSSIYEIEKVYKLYKNEYDKENTIANKVYKYYKYFIKT